MPSIQAVARPRRVILCRQRTRASACAMLRIWSAVPSPKSSSTKITSHLMPVSAAINPSISGAMLSRSLRVGTTTVNSGPCEMEERREVVSSARSASVMAGSTSATLSCETAFMGHQSYDQATKIGHRSLYEFAECMLYTISLDSRCCPAISMMFPPQAHVVPRFGHFVSFRACRTAVI